jgi:hypothetical protein
MGVAKPIRHTLVACITMLLVVWQSHTSELELLWRLDCMSVVAAQDSFAIGLMQSQ